MADDVEQPPAPTPRRYLELPLLLRAPGIASDGKKLILAAIGLLALAAGWSALARAFGVPDPTAGHRPGSVLGLLTAGSPDALLDAGLRMTEPARAIVAPFAALFSRGTGLRGWFASAAMALWAVAVWGIFGGAIARIAVVQAAGGGRVGIGSAARFALRKAGPLIGAPLTPMLAVAIFAAFCAGFGLLYRIPRGVGQAIAAALWFLPLLAGLMMALILLGLAAGWPLMHATVAAEGEDAPDALSRSYSYVNQRLARYAAHVAAAWAIGTAGLVLAILFARAVLHLADWGVSLGAPDPAPTPDSVGTIPRGWSVLVGWLVHGWIYSYFWTAASIIYLILRRDVDGTDWHDVYLPEQDADPFADGPGADLPDARPRAADAEPG